MEDIFLAIKNAIFHFHPLKNEEWEVLSEGLTVKNFNKGDFLIREGETENNIYFLNKGGTRSFFIRDGKDFTVDFQFEGDFVTGYYSLITREPSSINIELLEQTQTIVLPLKVLTEFYINYPRGEKIGRLMAEFQYLKRLKKEMDLLSQTAEERYAALLEKNPKLVRSQSVKHLSSYLGIQPESLSRIRKLYGRN